MGFASTASREVGSRSRAYPDALLHLCALSIVAGAIHAVAAVPHFSEYWAFGTFFAVLAAFQLAWGASIYARPTPTRLRVGIAVSIGVIALWIGSRTVGLPVGPEPWQAEHVDPLDFAATAAEALIVVLSAAFLALAPASPTRRALPGSMRPLQLPAMLIMGGGLLVLLLGGGHHLH